MNIIHCILSLNTGGSETMLIDIINEQVKTNYVTLIIVNKSYQQYLLNQINTKVKQIFLNRTPKSRNPWTILKLNYIIRKINADVIHVHSSSLLRMIYKPTGNGLFFTVHALHVPLKYAKHVNCLFAISDIVAKDIKERCNNKQIVIVPNGIIVENISQRIFHKPFKTFRIVNVARLDKTTKGQDILINAIALLKKQNFNNIEVDFIGTGESESDLKELVRKNNLENNIHFLGLQDRTYIYQNLRNYDLMCHPSRCEGFGLTVAEGIAAKLPVLVSSEDGPAEIIKNGELGIIFEKNNANDCAEKIKNIIRHYDDLEKMLDFAFFHIQNHYSVKRMTEQYMKAYLLQLQR